MTASAASVFVTPNSDRRRGLAPSSPGTDSDAGSGFAWRPDDEPASAAHAEAGAALVETSSCPVLRECKGFLLRDASWLAGRAGAPVGNRVIEVDAAVDGRDGCSVQPQLGAVPVRDGFDLLGTRGGHTSHGGGWETAAS